MPKKVKKVKKRVSSDVQQSSGVEDAPSNLESSRDPPLAEPSDQGIAKKRKTKKKIKLTKEEKKLAKLEKASQDFQSNKEEFGQFLDRIDLWLQTRHQQVMNLFGNYDQNGTGILSCEEFKLGMRDLNIPCTEAQLYTLTRLLDQNHDSSIDYIELAASLQRARFADQTADEYKEDGLEEEDNDQAEDTSAEMDCKVTECDRESLKLLPGPPRFLLLRLRLITFDNAHSHPGHFELVVRSDTQVYGLLCRIREKVGIESTQLSVFRDKTFSEESFLPPDQELEECGFSGGPRHCPPPVTLYYDYRTEFRGCPVVNCDYYFNTRRR